jgi:hypothetical protein
VYCCFGIVFTSSRPSGLDATHRLLEDEKRQAAHRLYGPTQEALVILAGFSAAAGIGHTEAVHSKVQQALLRRGLVGRDGELTSLGKKAAEAVLKEKYLRRR